MWSGDQRLLSCPCLVSCHGGGFFFGSREAVVASAGSCSGVRWSCGRWFLEVLRMQIFRSVRSFVVYDLDFYAFEFALFLLVLSRAGPGLKPVKPGL